MYLDKVNQSVVNMSSFGQEEAAARTELMEKEEFLVLQDKGYNKMKNNFKNCTVTTLHSRRSK